MEYYIININFSNLRGSASLNLCCGFLWNQASFENIYRIANYKAFTLNSPLTSRCGVSCNQKRCTEPRTKAVLNVQQVIKITHERGAYPF